MNDHDVTSLLERVTADLEPDTERLLAGGVARGRRLGRRRRLATGASILAAVAVVGGLGLAASQLGGSSTASDRGPGFAVRPSGGATPSPSVAVSGGPVRIVQVLGVRQIHAQLARMLPGKVGPVLRGDYVVLSTPSLRQFSFTYDDGYVIFTLQHEQGLGRRSILLQLSSGRHRNDLSLAPAMLNGVPYQDVLMAADAHGVRYASTTAFRDGYEVSLTVYNAAPPSRHVGASPLRRLSAAPVLDAHWRAEVVTSPVWFETP